MRHNVTIFATYGERTILVSDESVIAIFSTLFCDDKMCKNKISFFNGCKINTNGVQLKWTHQM